MFAYIHHRAHGGSQIRGPNFSCLAQGPAMLMMQCQALPCCSIFVNTLVVFDCRLSRASCARAAWPQVSISYLWNRLHRSDNALLEYGFFQQVLSQLRFVLHINNTDVVMRKGTSSGGQGFF